VDDEDSLGLGGEAVHVGHGTDDGEDLADLIMREASLLEGSADVSGALASPDDVSKPGGGVVEGADLKALVECGGDEGVAAAEAGAEDSEVLITLLFEPVDAAANVDDGLTACFGGAAYVRTDGVVGALEFGGAADIVVGLGEAETGDAEAVEERAERVMGEGVGVPLGHDDDCLLRLAFL